MHREKHKAQALRGASERMDEMKSKATYMLRILLGLALGLALMAVNVRAQQPSPSPKNASDAKTLSSTSSQVGEDAGDYTIISSIEFGYRGLRVGGNVNKYQSDLNYSAGPRIFDSSFLMRQKEGKGGGLFDDLMVTSTGWGADPYGNMRISVEKSEWYRFDGTYRRFKYFNYLNNIANPNFAAPSRQSDPVTGQHSYNTRQQFGDFDLTILPKNEKIRFTIGYSPEHYNGLSFTTYHVGGDDFMLPVNVTERANNYRFGVDGKLGPIDYSLLQGFRRFKDDSFINDPNRNIGDNPTASTTLFNTFNRTNPVRGGVNFTRASLHTFLAKKLDITGRVVYSSATSNFNFLEAITALNFNTRITGLPTTYNPPNILTLGQYNLLGNTKRPQTLGDFGITYLATDKLRISDTFRVETFQINGGDLYTALFNVTRTNGTVLAPIVANNGGAGYGYYRVTSYRKFQNTVEGDYQFNDRYSFHFGYRYGNRRIREFESGFGLNANLPAAIPTATEEETNHTNAFFGGLKAKPLKTWTLYLDAEHGTADNVFTRVGNYDYTNFRLKSRYAPNRKVSLNLAFITKNNSNPSEIDGVSLEDFGVSIKSRVFTSALDWSPNSKVSFSAGYNYNWQNSDAIVDYYYNAVRHPQGHSLYFVRNNFFYFDMTAQIAPRVTLYTAYRINKDNGQANRLADPTGNPGFLITSYPMSYQSPEGRLAVRLNRWLDWNVGYQYYNYRESPLISINPQNYHAHLPYTSLRIYFGRGRG
ncbi:MAG TPA: hypothetical protein VF779_01095 [Pyrinomonadaceae bacterium]